MNIPGTKKKKKNTPKNLEWTGVGKSFATTFHSGKIKDVPEEFEIATRKVKELQGQLNDVLKTYKSYDKALLGQSSSLNTLTQHMDEMVIELPEDILGELISTIRGILIETDSILNRFKEQLQNKLVSATDLFLEQDIIPARASRKRWESDRIELDVILKRVESLQKSSNPDAVRLFVSQSQHHFASMKEKQSFEIASDNFGDTLWKRDIMYLSSVVDMIIDLHQTLLDLHTLYYEKEEYEEKVLNSLNERLQEYTEHNEMILNEKLRVATEEYDNRYTPLVQLLSDEDLALVNAISITAGSEQEEILATVIKILDAHKETLPIIRLTITKEVESTSSSTTLFRGNSCATKLMSQFTRMTGRDYLFNTLQDIIQVVVDDPTGYEVDESKAKGEDISANMAKLMDTVQNFLDRILASITTCPEPFKAIAYHLRSEVVKRFPEANHTSVGGFIFLRFFCPAVMSPDSQGLVEGVIDPKARRPLILISKSLQNIANGLMFGKKEEYMEDMNRFIEENLNRVHNFFDQLATEGQEDYEPLCSLEDAKNVELPSLHHKIVQNLEKISNSLIMYNQDDVIHPLCAIMGDLGKVDVQIIPQKPKKKKK
eukprot:TRINITY_DN10101_c0_g1_i1.p1 TRINITY_DN10101_c0_g1~~TRINITY_DN10101_c0_g1_i1.p1  ORF type:complete len:601 (+),score=142.25 TRINITY_DN10101_c0_g1_i1:212-2014(+)